MQKTKPDWLRIRVKSEHGAGETIKLLRELDLCTVCEEANCPNMYECFGRRTATFMILGRVCTRNCAFCNVAKGSTDPVDESEPVRISEAVEKMRLRHVVVTSVTRDDIPDGGAGHFASVVKEIRDRNPGVVIEVLIPDFKGDRDSLGKIIKAKPDIIGHNIETVPRLYPAVRPMADYKRSLEVIARVSRGGEGIYTKSGIMVGLGESEEEVVETFKELREVGCNFLTIGQYLAPSKNHYPVIEYIHPEVFEKLRLIALETGFEHVASAPFVRSSYMADKALEIKRQVKFSSELAHLQDAKKNVDI